jgi:signal transduction histidine kinase
VSHFAELIENSGRRLLATLDSVLNLSKLEAGEMDLERHPVDLVEEAEAVVDELRAEADGKEITLQIDASAPSVRAVADAGGIQIIARNLVSNAIKYTAAGGTIWVRIHRDERTGPHAPPDRPPVAVLEVEDTGVGMKPEHTEDLFEPFRQASEGKGREYEGTGIGLAVTKEVVDRMDGTIAVDTEEGEGSRFTVRLPLADREDPETVTERTDPDNELG